MDAKVQLGDFARRRRIEANRADNYDAALAIVRECPAAAAGSGWSIEIREMFGFA
jgi:hypothetical protein